MVFLVLFSMQHCKCRQLIEMILYGRHVNFSIPGVAKVAIEFH